jgi:putative phosphoribosyl transferase
MSRNELGLGFRDRTDAGRALGHTLLNHHAWNDPLVLALPRGGVPVAYEVARALDAPLDVLVVRKIGHPRQEEFAIGAIAGGGVRVMNEDSAGLLGELAREDIEKVVAREEAELARREAQYRGDSMPVSATGHEVILVDDGLATGATMRAAVQAVRSMDPARITVAVPVGAAETCDVLRAFADDVICVRTPEPFRAISLWYQAFPQVSDDEVRDLLQRANRHVPT